MPINSSSVSLSVPSCTAMRLLTRSSCGRARSFGDEIEEVGLELSLSLDRRPEVVGRNDWFQEDGRPTHHLPEMVPVLGRHTEQVPDHRHRKGKRELFP